MANLRIGRIADGGALTNVDAVDLTPDSIRITGRIAVGSDYTVEQMKVIRDQLLGLASHDDEVFVPMVFAKDPTLTGMVRVREVRVPIDPGELDEQMRMGPRFDIVADRVGAQPNIESHLIGGWRNTATVATSLPTAWHAVPAAALDYYDGVDTFQTLPTVRTADTGAVNFYRNDGFGAGVTGNATARWSVPEANWYDGAAAIEMLHSPTEWHTVIGRHLAPTAGMDKARAWRLTNGLVRVYPSPAGGTLEVQAYSGGAWGTAKVIKFAAADGVGPYEFNRIHTVAVSRNTPEQCVVRLTVGLEAASLDYPHRVVLDLALRRGDRIIDGRMSTTGQNMLGSVGTDPGEAGTAITGNGGGRTDTAVNSNRFVLLTPAATAFGAGASVLDSSGAGNRKKAWSFGVGWEIGGSGSADPERATDLRNQYFAPFWERTTVVGW